MSNPIQGATRTITDADLEVSVAIPAADANVDSAALDLGGPSIAALEKTELEVSIPALAALAEGTDVTVTVQDSADGETFAAVEELAPFAATGGDGDGSDAVSAKYRLPSTTRQYVRVNVASDADSGDNTDSAVTFRLLS